MPRPKEIARRIAAALLLWSVRLSNRKLGIAVLYHEVVEAASENGHGISAPCSAASFERQLRMLASTFAPTTASGLPAAAASRRRGGRIPIAITFDDDLLAHLQVAAPRLAARGLPATFFLCGASLTAPWRFWWQLLEQGLEDGHELADLVGPSLARRLRAAGAADRPPLAAGLLRRLPPAERAELDERLQRIVGDAVPTDAMGADAVSELAQRGFEIGFHTLRHYSLPRLTDEELANAVREGRDALETVVGAPLTVIAYPYGDADDRVATAARAEFRAGFSTKPRPVEPQDDPLLLGRIEPPTGSSDGRFALSLARALLGRPYR